MKNKKDDDAIVFDRDTSAPKNKMRNPSGRRAYLKNNQMNNQNQNNLIKQPNNIQSNQNNKKKDDENEEEEEEEDVVEEVEEEMEDGNKKQEEKNEKKDEEKKEEKKEIKKEEKKETEPKITIHIKKNETINSNNKSNNNINNKNNSNNNNSNINNQNINKNIILKNSSSQVNLITDEEKERLIQTLKIKINNLVKDKQKLIDQAEITKNNYEEQINRKKQEILTLSQINAKLKKNLEKVSNQVNKLLDKMVEKKNIQKSGSSKDLTNINLKSNTNNKRFISSALNRYKLDSNELNSNEEYKDKDKSTEIELLKEKLKMKESQLKNSLNLIEFLSKDNKRLKLLYESLGKDNVENNKLNNYKLMEEIKKKNKEILQLEKEYKDIASLKSGDKELEYYKSQVIQLKEANNNHLSKIKKLKLTLDEYKNKELSINKKNNFPISPLINSKSKINISNESKISLFKNLRNNQNIKDKRSLSVINSHDWRNHELNNNFGRLFNEAEKKALFTLFDNEDDYKKFNQKLKIIENHYNAAAKRYQTNINELKQSIDDKDEQIAYLREKIRENEMKIKILLNQVHLERHKKDKIDKKTTTNQQGFNKNNNNTTKNS